VQNDDSTDHTFTIPEVDLNEGIDPGEDVGVDVSALTEDAYPFPLHDPSSDDRRPHRLRPPTVVRRRTGSVLAVPASM
jgi:hypothetical protein